MQSKSEQEAAGLQSELELASEEMDRSQQRLATLEQEKAALLARLQQQQQQQQAAALPGAEGGEGGAGSSGKAAEESLRQELYAQVRGGPRPARLSLLVLPAWRTKHLMAAD